MSKLSDLEEKRTQFNLLDEGWIKVMRSDFSVEEVSLKCVFKHAHEYIQLDGEMETQNASVLRLLLSVVMSVFYRYDAEGEFDPFDEDSDPDDVIERWEAVWKEGQFPSEVIEEYLEKYRDHFWLFHPDRPFWQVNDLEKGTEYSVKTLYGNLKESNNAATRHHFSQKSGYELEQMHYSEGVRWLIHLNDYSVNVKPKSNIGRMGMLGFVMFKGDNLFETLMLNSTFLKDGNEVWGNPEPVWEKENINLEMNNEIPIPDNYPELYTMQSRRIQLYGNNGVITGYKMAPGDVISKENIFCEQMTKWRKIQDKKTDRVWFEPEIHDPSIQIWREFPSLITNDENSHTPGIVKWMNLLMEEGVLEKEYYAVIQTVGMTYGNMSYAYEEAVSDSLALSAQFFSELSNKWKGFVIEEVNKCSHIADNLLRMFADYICIYQFGEKSESLKKQKEHLRAILKERYYDLIDMDFREWLFSIRPDQDDEIEKITEWRKKSYIAASIVAKEQISSMVNNYFILRKGNGKTYSIPEILNVYMGRLKKVYNNLYPDRKEGDDIE